MSTPSDPKSGASKRDGILILLLLLATALLYARVLGYESVSYDDNTYVFQNETVQEGLTLDGVRWALGSGLASNWHPITWISHMLDVTLFGIDRPGLHHATSVVLHLLNTGLLYLLVLRLSGRSGRALFVAAVFGLHPTHIESVAWIAERKDVLSTAFWLASLLCYERFVRTERRGWYLLNALLLALGLMSKPMLVTAPFVLLLLDAWPFRRLGTSAVLEKVPLFLLVIASSATTFLVQEAGGATKSLPFIERIGTALTAYVRYLGKSFWPADLAVLYPHPVEPWPLLSVAGSALLLVLLTFLAYRLRSERAVLGGWLWYLGTLVPVIGLVQVGMQSMADRYTYVPMIGLSIAVVWAFEFLRRDRGGNMAPWIVGVAVCVALGARSWAHLPVWRDSASLYGHALSVTEGNRMIHNNYGSALFDREEFEAAVRHFRASLELDPNFPQCRRNLIIALQAAGRHEEAIEETRVFVQMEPQNHALVHELAQLQQHFGAPEEAAVSYARYVELEPEDAAAWNGLGQLRRELGDPVAALDCFRRAAELDGDLRDAHWNLAASLVEAGDTEAAIDVLQQYLYQHVFDQETRQMLQRLQAEGGR